MINYQIITIHLFADHTIKQSNQNDYTFDYDCISNLLLSTILCIFIEICKNYILIISTGLQCVQFYNFIKMCSKFPLTESLSYIVFEINLLI